MENTFVTNRLSLQKITLNDAAFILELVNTPEWIEFIGNRNGYSLKEAENYIHKILISENTQYWVVKLKEQEIPVGVITLLKREHLAHHDIGFAFLNHYKRQGYALEASLKIVQHALKEFGVVLAITLPNNLHSIKLLQKLDFKYDSELETNQEKLLVYQLTLVT